MRRFLIILSVMLMPLPVYAAGDVASDSSGTSVKIAPLDPVKQQALELDKLFGDLHGDKGKRDPDGTELKIRNAWMRNASPMAEVLLGQATMAMQEGAFDTSETMLDTVIGSYPEYMEALDRRATLYFQTKRFDEALSDIELVLDLEPRHFGALAGRGMILHAQGKLKEAEAALREALAINPQMEIVKNALKKIEHDEPDI